MLLRALMILSSMAKLSAVLMAHRPEDQEMLVASLLPVWYRKSDYVESSASPEGSHYKRTWYNGDKTMVAHLFRRNTSVNFKKCESHHKEKALDILKF